MKPAIFLDRDGTINVDKNYLYKIKDFEYIDGVLPALKRLEEYDFQLVIITNQSGIARGYYTEEEYANLNNWMIEDLKSRGIWIAGSYYCPHHPGGLGKYGVSCICRKPNIELFRRAINELDIDVANSYAIGDKLRDIAICREYDVQGVLLDKNKLVMGYRKPIWQCHNLLEAANQIVEYEKAKTE